MARLTLIISGLVSLVLGILMSVPPAAAQEQIALRVLAEQRVELLPQGPVCWAVSRSILPPGGIRPPGGGYHAHALYLGYQVEGSQRLEYAGGPTLTHQLRTGTFIGNNNWHAHINVGTSPAEEIFFTLLCDAPPLPAITRLAQTATLPGVRSGPAPYVVRLIEGTGGPGAQYPAHQHAGPETVYVVEGGLAVATEGGVIRLNAGESGVIPPGVPHQPTAVGNTRFLVAALTPVPEPHLQLLPDVRLPSPGPVALPRTGEELPWAGPLSMLVGALLLAAGVGLRRARM